MCAHLFEGFVTLRADVTSIKPSHSVWRRGLNHVGDWGTQFGMLIEYMKEAYPNFQEKLPEVHDLQEFYKASRSRFVFRRKRRRE